MLDFSSLTKAITSLTAALEEARVRPGDEFVRDASIQRFATTDRAKRSASEHRMRYSSIDHVSHFEVESATSHRSKVPRSLLSLTAGIMC